VMRPPGIGACDVRSGLILWREIHVSNLETSRISHPDLDFY
jgi:hypothetical protein